MGKFDTHGGYFAPKDYFRINTGGSHSENPNGGVQIGVDQNGVPNLLEEGEPVFKDFVFSDNIKANKSILKDMSIPEKYAGMLYSEIADKFIEEAEMRPMDPVSNNGLRAMLSRLADAQEEQKLRKEEAELKAELKKLSPDELQALNTMLVQQEQINPQEQAVLPQMQVGMPQNVQQVPQEEYVQQAPVIMANGGLLKPYTANYFEDGTPGEEKPKRKINWERVGGIAAGSIAGAGAGAMQGLSGGPWGAAGLGILGAISGGSAAANLYDGDYLGAALDLASMGAGKGLMMTGRKALGMVPKAASLESVMKGAQKAAIQSAKLTAKKDAVKVAEGEVKQAVKDVTATSKNLEKQRKAIETLVAKGENLSTAEKKALEAAKKEYKTAAKQIESNSRNLLDAESSMRKASRKLWWAEHIKNPLPAIGRGIQKADNWVWDNASSYLFDPSKLAGKSSVLVHVPHALGITAISLGVPTMSLYDKVVGLPQGSSERSYVETSPEEQIVEEEFANPFENFAEGGKLANVFEDGNKIKKIAPIASISDIVKDYATKGRVAEDNYDFQNELLQQELNHNQDAINMGLKQLNAEPSVSEVQESSYPTAMRYAGILNNLFATMNNMAQTPDKYQYTPVSVDMPTVDMPLQMQQYVPMDMSLPMNQIAAQSNATSRAIRNSGSGPATGALLLANGLNAGNALGNAALQGYLTNAQQRNATIAANNAAIAQRASMLQQAAERRAELQAQINMQNRRNALQIQGLNNQSRQAKASAVGTTLENLASGLAGIGTENFRLNTLKNLPYTMDDHGNLSYNYGARGGCLKKFGK